MLIFVKTITQNGVLYFIFLQKLYASYKKTPHHKVEHPSSLSGTELPSTGGSGTTIFYVIGAILVIGAGVVLVTRRRMNQAMLDIDPSRV